MVINNTADKKHLRRKKNNRSCSWIWSGLKSRMKRFNGRLMDRRFNLYGCVKGFLWFFLFVYLFIWGPDLLKAFLFSSTAGEISGMASLHSTTAVFSSSKLSRVLIETNTTKSMPAAVMMMQSQKRMLSPAGEIDVRIYVYELPAKFNTDWLSNERCSKHLFAAEVAIHRALMAASVRTMNPELADFFYVPVYGACNFSTVNGFPAIKHARSLFKSAVNFISRDFPFWNRSSGADHVFVATHDHGACFHTMEDAAKRDGILEYLRRSVIVQTFGVKSRHPCQDADTIQIPPYVSPEAIREALLRRKGKRDIFTYFRGKMEIHPKNVSGRIYSKGVRTAIWRKYSNRRRYYIKRDRFDGYLSEMVRSVFCLCPLGWAPWSPRIVESVELGCVPVIIADDIRLPFPDAVGWSDIAVVVPEKDVGKLAKILEEVALGELPEMQRRLWKEGWRRRRALLFNVPMKPGDATWQVLEELARRAQTRRRMSALSVAAE